MLLQIFIHILFLLYFIWFFEWLQKSWPLLWLITVLNYRNLENKSLFYVHIFYCLHLVCFSEVGCLRSLEDRSTYWSSRDYQLSERVQRRATKMMKGAFEMRGNREQRLLSLEKRRLVGGRGILSMWINKGFGENVEEGIPLEKTRSNNTNQKRKLWGWSNTKRDCPERFGSLNVWRYSELNWL